MSADFEYSYINSAPYPSITHPVGEVVNCVFTKKPTYSKRNRRTVTEVSVELDILALGCDYNEVVARELQIVEAYTYDNGEFRMTAPNNTKTSILMPASGLSDTGGVVLVSPVVVEGPNLPDGKSPEEGVIKRTIHVKLTSIWEELDSRDSGGIVWYEEKFEHFGSTGMAWVSQNTLLGPKAYQTWPKTTKYIRQSGESLGLNGWYLNGAVPTPFLPPQYEHLEQRVEVLGKPVNFSHLPTFNNAVTWLYFPAKWQYVFEIDFPVTISPDLGPFVAP